MKCAVHSVLYYFWLLYRCDCSNKTIRGEKGKRKHMISEPCIVLMDGSLFWMFCVSDCRGDTKLSIFEGDIRDADFLKKTCRGASTVFHIASIIDVNDSVEPSEIYGVNVKGKAAALIQ